jgi:Protein of unknown function (DUF1838)
MTTPSPIKIPVSRRSLLGAVTLILPGGPVCAADPVDLDDPAHRMNAVMKIYGATDDRVCFGFVKGIYYGVVDQRLTPMFGVLAAVFNRFVPRADGTFDGATFEVAYFTDLNTGERLEKYTNPITGETVDDVPITRSGPHPLHVTPDAAERVFVAGANREVKQRFLPFRIVRDNVWLVEEIQARFTNPNGSSTSNASITNYGAQVSEVLDPKRKTVATDVNYTATVPWRPWLKMGNRPGAMIGNATGRRVASIDELPANYVALTKKLHPDVLEDPLALLKTVKAAG